MKVWSRVVIAAAVVALALSAAAAYAATPSPKAPGAPRNLKAVVGDQQMTLSWIAPTTGAPVFYNVITTPSDYPRTNTPSTTLTATGLHNGTAYTFAVRAWNGSIFGPATRVTATPRPTPPGPPTSLAATPGPADGQYTFTWAPPKSAGSSPSGSPPATIDHYTVKISPSSTCVFLDPTKSCIASNIADNITSTFSVTATNSRNVTGAAATVLAPLPSGATIGLQPTAGTLSGSITATGQNFLDNESITLYWDSPSHAAATVVTDATGAFTKVVKPFQTDKPAIHKLCANVPPKPCANFTLQAVPTPIPTPSSAPDETPSPSAEPSGNPLASGATSGGSGSGLGFITKPPFVFLPILVILGLLGVLAYWAMSSRRRPVAPSSATVVHRATRPDYMAPFPASAQPPPVPPAVAPPAPPVPPAAQPPQPPPVVQAPQPQPPVVQAPQPPAASPPVEWPQAPPKAAPPATPSPPPPPATWPAAPDEPPDLPEPSD